MIKEGGGGGEGGKETLTFPSLLSPNPSFLFWLLPQFRAGKIPFLGLSLLLNPTETLATQAKENSYDLTYLSAVWTLCLCIG